MPALDPRLEVRVEPIALVRGTSVRVPVQVARRDTTAPLTVRLTGAPAGVAVNGEIVLPGAQSNLELSLSAEESATYGDYALQLSLRGADVESIVPIALQVRGKPGAIDTSFGNEGALQRVSSGKIGDLMVDAAGRYVVSGGYDAVSETMLMARYTANGQLDPAFGTGGVARWAPPYPDHYSHPEMRPGYYRGGTLEWNGGYSLTAFLEGNNVGMVVHSELTADGKTPRFIPTVQPSNLGSVNGGPRVLRDLTGTDASEYFRFQFGCKISKHFSAGPLNINWPVQGVADLGLGSGCQVEDAVLSDTTIFTVVGSTAGRSIASVQRASAKVNAPTTAFPVTAAANGPVLLSRPNAAGNVLALSRTTLYQLDASGTATGLHGTRHDEALQPSSALGGFGWYFPDGRIGVLLFGATRPVLHVLDATGEHIGPAAGVELEDKDFARYKSVVEVYPDARGGVVVLYPQQADGTETQPWTVKRFWL